MATITVRPEQEQLVEKAFALLHARIAPAKLNPTHANGTYFSLWLGAVVQELPKDAQTLAACLYTCIKRHLADDVIDWQIEPAAMAKFRRVDRPPIQAGRNVSDENQSATERDKEYEQKQRVLAAQKASASGYASARKVAELFVLEGRLGESIEFRKKLLVHIAKQQGGGRDGQSVYKEVERLANERYHAHRRRLEML